MRLIKGLSVVLALVFVLLVAPRPAAAEVTSFAAASGSPVLGLDWEAPDLALNADRVPTGADLSGPSLPTTVVDSGVSAAEICLPQEEPDCSVEEFNVNIAYIAEGLAAGALILAIPTLNPIIIAGAIAAVDVATLNLFSANLALYNCEHQPLQV